MVDDYDFVLIDCPPSLGLLTVNGLSAAHEVLVPIQCEYYALEGLGQLLRNVELVRKGLNPTLDVTTIILVMYDARTKLADQVVQEVRDHFGDKVCRTVVPRTVRLSEAPSFGQPIMAFDPDVPRRHRLPGAGQGGEWWCAAAGSVRDWGPSSPPTARRTSVPPSRSCPVGSIEPNPHQPRSTFDEDTLTELTASIREVGVLQPVLVRPSPKPGRYQLIAGERRLRAAHRAGLDTIPAIVRASDDLGSVEQALVENLHRQDLNPLDEAAGYQQLIDDFGLTHDEVARRVGKSRVTVTNTLRLLQLPPTIQHLRPRRPAQRRPRPSPARHPRPSLPGGPGPPGRAEGWSVRAVEEAVRARAGGQADDADDDDDDDDGVVVDLNRGTPLRPPGLLELEELLSDYLDTRVRVTMGAKRGKVVVEFATLEDLERIYRLVTEPAPPA